MAPAPKKDIAVRLTLAALDIGSLPPEELEALLREAVRTILLHRTAALLREQIVEELEDFESF